MTDMPKCPNCGLEIEVYRMKTPLCDSNLNPIYGIHCGCADCDKMVHIQCVVSEGMLASSDSELLKKFWDFEYKLAVGHWKIDYKEGEE